MQSRDRPKLRYKKAWLVLGAIGSVVVIVVLVIWIFVLPDINVEQRESAPITNTTPTASQLEVVRELLGPWRIVSTPYNGEGVLMLHTNGVAEASEATPTKNNWTPSILSSIIDTVPGPDNIGIRLGNGTTFRIRTDQLFILDTAPDKICEYTVLKTGDPQLVCTASTPSTTN